MNRTAVTVCLASLFPAAALAQKPAAFVPGTYEIDPAHSKIGFEVDHLVISSVDGRFGAFKGTITLGDALTSSKVEAYIDTASIETGVKDRDEHLRSADFFDAKAFPVITFKSKKVTGTHKGFRIVGDLTLKGVTKEVTLDTKDLGTVKDAYGNTKAAFDAKTSIDRKAFGLMWNKAVEAGPVVGDEVVITLKLQAAKKDKT